MSSGGGLAEELFNAYGDEVGWRAYNGEQMKRWPELPDKVKDGWHAAAAKAAELLG